MTNRSTKTKHTIALEEDVSDFHNYGPTKSNEG